VGAGTGTASASYNYAGDANHTISSDLKTFTIDPASSTTTVTCPVIAQTYTGLAITPCSVTVTGAGGLSLTPAPVYLNNVGAGTGTASASYNYAGDANHTISSDLKTFTIDPASSMTTVTCPVIAQTYTGSAITPCSVTVTGAGGLSLTPDPSYANNVDVGTASASYSYIGDANHASSSDSKTFEISSVPKIDQTITFGALSSKTYGDLAFDVSASASSGLPVSFTIVSGPATVSGSTITITGAGSVTVRASQEGNDTYNAAPNVDQAFTVNQATPTITWPNPADITLGTALSGTQLNAAASAPGVFVYTPAAGTVLGAGAGQTLHAAFTPTDATNYTVASKDVTINVTGSLPSILYINGTVTNNTLLGEPLAGVTVKTGLLTAVTGPDGKYSFVVVSGSYDLTFTKNDIRYYTGSKHVVVDVPVANGDFALQLKPVGIISGSVTVGDLLGWV
jgi:hypothetical protein